MSAVQRSAGPRDVFRRYGGAVALTLAIIVFRVALDPILGRQNNRHLVMLPGVMLAAWMGGFGPGILAALVDALALEFFWSPPHERPLSGGIDIALFVLVGAAVSALVASLREARSRADGAREARDHMMAIVAHDLSNPLNLIRLASAALRRAPGDATALAKRLSTIDRAVDRMDRLIRDLVDATHIEHEQLAISIEDEWVAGMLREVVDSFVTSAGEKGIALVLQLPPEDLCVRADRSRLTQVFGNLLGNALKFTPSGGRVELRAREADRVVLFEVEDTGSGIEPADLPHVFERYWKRGGGGTGLGLFISRSIVASHGGQLLVRSEPGRGSTFSFSIPRAPRGRGAERAAVERATASPGS